jgi:hypothetical protein
LAGRRAGLVDDRLGERGPARSGDVSQPHVRPWATVLRIPTGAGPVWFTASTFAYEAGIVSLLAARRPEVVPPVPAADQVTGWMLMAGGGEPLRTVSARERREAGRHRTLPRRLSRAVGRALRR